MSSALPYLQKLRKSQLAEFAEATDLHNYEDYNKPELATALDDHLQANRSIFSNDEKLSEYYRRLSQTPRRGSPVKREIKVDATPEAPRSARRRSTKAKEEVEPTDESDAAPSTDLFQTPGQPVVSIRPPLPPSPAVVTDAIDRQTAVLRKSIGDAWSTSGVQEQSNALRTALSSVKAVEIIVLTLEFCGLIRQIVPLRFLTTVSAVDALHTPDIAIKVPDLFVLVDGAFWAPFSLWLFTSFVLPLTAAYFFNFSNATSSGRRGRPAAQANFDPLSFNIAKALVAYLVYANRFTFWNLYSPYSVAKVNASVPGQWAGLLTGSAIGVIGTLYEAILRK